MSLLLFVLLVVSAATAGNPGILIAVPFPLSVPTVNVGLPLPLQNIVVNNLQLTNTRLTQLDYSWLLNYNKADVNVSHTRLTFDWHYKQHHGTGYFTEETLNIQLIYAFLTSPTQHLQINVTHSNINPGHSKVVLGGGVPEIVAVEVTNLILNHASILFRSFISKQLSRVLSALAAPLTQDQRIYSDIPTKTAFYLNTSLVAAPLATNKSLLLQLNAATYVPGKPSGSLNPPDILVRTNSTQIQVHIHRKVATQFIALLLQVKGGDISLQLRSSQITTILDVNSYILSPLFPKMAHFADERDVIFDIKVPSLDLTFRNDNIRIEMDVYSNVASYNSIEKRKQLYIDRIDGRLAIEVGAVFGQVRNSIRIASIQALAFSAHTKDVQENRIKPQAIQKYLGFLTQWVADAINLQLNRKVKAFTYNDILVVLKGQVRNNVAYYLQIQLVKYP